MACLKNGFSIRHDRREVIGDKTRLYMGTGYLDVLTAEIDRIEPDDTPAPVATSTPGAPSKTIHDHLLEASQSSGIDRDFLESVVRHESGFNPKAVSPKGARGLMQLMPETAGQLGVKDSFDPQQNIQGGTAYLKQLLELYHGDAQKALAAYNAGPHRVEQYRGVPPYRETRAYVAGIIREYNRKKLTEQKAAKTGAAAQKKTTAATKSRAASTAPATTTKTGRSQTTTSAARGTAQPGS